MPPLCVSAYYWYNTYIHAYLPTYICSTYIDRIDHGLCKLGGRKPPIESFQESR